MELIVRRLRKTRAKTKIGITRKLGMSLRFIASGAFRDVYSISDKPLVIKIPHDKSGIAHARNEHKMIKKLKRRIPEMMPEVVYFNRATGVAVHRKYSRLGVNSLHADKAEQTLIDKKLPCGDMHYANVALDGKVIKIIDLGCFRGRVR